ncbi:MAG: acyltransferase family protein [Planctomycetota bacterium]
MRPSPVSTTNGTSPGLTIRNRPKTNPENGIFAAAGLALIAISYLFSEGLNAGVSIGVLGASLIIAFGQTGVCNSILSHSIPVHVGKLSYSLYLWHWPVIVLSEHVGVQISELPARVLLGCLMYPLALGTYQLVEKPTRGRKGIVPGVLCCGFATLLAALNMGTTLRLYDTSEFNEARYVNYNTLANPEVNPEFQCTTIMEWPGYRSDAYYTGGIQLGSKPGPPQIVVLGDSHAVMWSTAIASIAQEADLRVSFYQHGGVSAFMKIPPTGKQGVPDRLTPSEKLKFDTARLRDIERWQPELVIISDFWPRRHLDDAKPLLQFLHEQGSKVLLIEDPPMLKCGTRNVMQWLASQGVSPREGLKQFVPYQHESENVGGRKLVRDLSEMYDHVEMLPTYNLFTSDVGALVLDGRSVLYYDDDHLLQAGARKIIPSLKSKITEMLITQ